MKEITYKISRGENGKLVEREEVSGLMLFELYGYQWGAHREMSTENESFFENWIISEVSTGFELESGKIFFDKDAAKDWAWKYLIEKGDVIVRYRIEQARQVLIESV